MSRNRKKGARYPGDSLMTDETETALCRGGGLLHVVKGRWKIRKASLVAPDIHSGDISEAMGRPMISAGVPGLKGVSGSVNNLSPWKITGFPDWFITSFFQAITACRNPGADETAMRLTEKHSRTTVQITVPVPLQVFPAEETS